MFDYIVVGGGTAGVTLASRMTQLNPSLRIALVEAGEDKTDDPQLTNPFAMFAVIGGAPDSSGIMRNHYTAPQKALNNRQIHNYSGRTLSGSSAVNVGVWLRPTRGDMQALAEAAGHDRFTFDNMLPYMKRTETWWEKGVDQEFHGFTGPVNVITPRDYPLRKTIERSLVAKGHTFRGDGYNGLNDGVCVMPNNFRPLSESTSERQHASRVYDLSRVECIFKSTVQKVLFTESTTSVPKATAIELVDGTVLEARVEIILCGGAIRSPQTLLLSGIGPAHELSRLGIKQIVDSPGVGQNLWDHSTIPLFYRLKDPSKGQALPFKGHSNPSYTQGSPMNYQIHERAPRNVLHVDDSHPLLLPTRTHTALCPFYSPILWEPSYSKDIPNPLDGSHITMLSLLLLPSARGRIYLETTSASDDPILDPQTLTHPRDQALMRYAVRSSIRLANTSPLSEELDEETPPDGFPVLSENSSDADIDARVRQFTTSIQHLGGTAAIGTVLDADFRVKGVEGLRVVDMSIFPDVIGTMPQALVYAVAELAAEVILGKA